MVGQNFQRVGWVYWLLPAAFAVHDSEELLTIPAWMTSHREELEAIAKAVEVSRDFFQSLPTTTVGVAAAVGFMFLIFLAVTLGATLRRGRGFWQHAYACILGGFFLHLFTHVGESLYFGGYTPGVVGAVLAGLPATLYIYRRLFRAQLLSRRAAILAALVGLALFLPGALLALSIGRRLAGR